MAKRKHPVNTLTQWMAHATPDEQEQLARGADTTRGALYQVASGHRRFRPGKAGALEATAAKMRAANPALPELFRTDLAPECAGCPYARKCLGSTATRTDFPIVRGDE